MHQPETVLGPPPILLLLKLAMDGIKVKHNFCLSVNHWKLNFTMATGFNTELLRALLWGFTSSNN